MSVLADGGEDFAGHPALEGLSLRLAGYEDDFVEACLSDDVCLLAAPWIVDDVGSADPILI